MKPSPTKKNRVGEKLLRWYRTHRRDLPWRRTKDPYKIWVSEIMLQQTTVETVIPYYEKFLKRFPTVGFLAEADEEEVLRYWSGLGYYSRARNLHRAARILLDGDVGAIHESPLPKTAQELCRLPGIGRYTAGAIASIAFGERVPVVDGNVIRVFSRLFCMSEDPKSSRGQKAYWKKAEEILPPESERGKVPFRSERSGCGKTDGGCGGRAGSPPTLYADFNQALMELGATLCSPRCPACLVCPLFSACGARKSGRQEFYPRIAKRPPSQKIMMTAALIRKGESFLMVQRSRKGVLKGMWEFPMVEGGPERLMNDFGFRLIRHFKAVRHSVLNRRLTIIPYLCQGGKLPKKGFRWVRPEEIDRFPTSSMNRKILSQFIQA